MRLNRFISAAGAASRRRGDTLISQGRVSVNGVIVTDPSYQVNSETDSVALDSQTLVVSPERRYYLLNKPEGVIVSRGDTHGRVTVFDVLGEGMHGVFPVGRLDADTSGVLLLTDDGALTYRLTHPSYGVEKIYRAEVYGKVTEEDIDRLRVGIVLDDGPSAPAAMTILSLSTHSSLVEIVMHQGRKRQVRRMLSELDHPVRVLERISFGGITAENVPLGSWRALTDSEIARLQEMTGLLTK